MTFALTPTPSIEALAIAGLSSTIACIISIWNIMQHLIYWNRPDLQIYIVRILLIVPIYALNSIFSLSFRHASLYFDTIRDVYEAFVLYCFLSLLLVYAGGEQQCVDRMIKSPGLIHHPWPFHRLQPIQTDGRFLRNCKQAAIQFILVKPIMAIVSIIMLANGQYDSWGYSIALAVIYNVSYSVALYMLVLFYMATHIQLTNFNPILKFASVKLIVFFTYWQSFLVLWLPSLTEEQSSNIQSFLLCCEMCIFATVQFFAFSPSEFKYVTSGKFIDNQHQMDSAEDIDDINIQNKSPYNDNDNDSIDISIHNNNPSTNDLHSSSNDNINSLSSDQIPNKKSNAYNKHRQMLNTFTTVIDLKDVYNDTKRTFGRNYDGYTLRGPDHDTISQNPMDDEAMDDSGTQSQATSNTTSPRNDEITKSQSNPNSILNYFRRNKHQRLKDENKNENNIEEEDLNEITPHSTSNPSHQSNDSDSQPQSYQNDKDIDEDVRNAVNQSSETTAYSITDEGDLDIHET